MKKILALVLLFAGMFAVGAQTPEKEVYIGIISFDQSVRDLTGGKPILMNATGLERLLGIIRNDYQLASVPGTALYYAVHQGLANLSANEPMYPDNLGSVSIVTFTDGLDNQSTSPQLKPLDGQSFGGKRLSEYQSYLKSQLASGFTGRTVRGHNITAYSVGVMGNDIDPSNETAFEESIQTVANTGNAYKIKDFGQLENVFREIADSLYTKTVDITFEAVTPAYPVGTKVRMTFDVPRGNNTSSAAADSRRYLEGEVAYTDGKYQLLNIAYGGDMSSVIQRGSAVSGTLDGVVTYVFPNIVGYNPATDQKPRQWSMAEGGQVWQVNSEYDSNDDPTTKEESHPAVIYLVLDCSTSLTRESVEQIRTAAERFLKIMYSGDTAQPVAPPRSTTADATPPVVNTTPSIFTPNAYEDFTASQRFRASLLNTFLGVGTWTLGVNSLSFGAQLVGGFASGLEIGGAICIIMGALTPAETDEYGNTIEGSGGGEFLLMYGGICYAIGAVIGWVAPWMWHKVQTNVTSANSFDGLNLAVLPTRKGSAVQLSYTWRF